MTCGVRVALINRGRPRSGPRHPPCGQISYPALDGGLFVFALLPVVVGLVMILLLVTRAEQEPRPGIERWQLPPYGADAARGAAVTSVTSVTSGVCGRPVGKRATVELQSPRRSPMLPARSRIQCNWSSERQRRKPPNTPDSDRQMFV